MLKKSLLLGSTAVLSAAIATPASAQVEEIIVTATKREQTLQEIPIAVSVTTGETIEQATILDISDLQTVVPSLRVTQLQNAGATNFIIRGFGNGANNPGIEPSVGVFIDGVYRSRSGAQIGDLPRLNRSEVLRGPQSTLFGKNASVGVISLVTEKPSFEPTGEFELTYGNFNQVRGKAYYSQGVGDDFAYAISGGFNRRDGFSESLQPGVDDLNDRDRFNLRFDSIYQVNDDTEFRFIADYSEINEVCCVAQFTDAFTGAAPVLNGIPVGTDQNGAALFGALSNPGLVGLTLSQPLDFNDPNDPFTFTNNVNSAPINNIQDFGFSGQVDTLLAGIDTTLILAYRENENFANIDADFSNIDFLGTSITSSDISTFTAELRFNGTSFDNRLNWTLGGFYFDEDIVAEDGLRFGVDTRPAIEFLGAAGAGLTIPEIQATFSGLEAVNGFAPGTFFGADLATDEVGNLNNQSFNLFANFDFEVTDKFTLTVGGAYTRDEKDFDIFQSSNNEFSFLDLTDFSTVGPILIGGGIEATLPGAIADATANVLPGAIQGALGAEFPGAFGGLAAAGLIPGSDFTPENVAAVQALGAIPGVLPDGGAAAFAGFEAAVTAGTTAAVIDGTTDAVTQGVTAAVAGSDLTNPANNPLLGFQALQLVPQTVGLPNGFEDTNIVDDDISFTVRGAYDVTNNINVYASYSTGFKASSVNLSRNSAPLLTDFLDANGRPIAEAFGLLPNNTTVRLVPTADFPVGQLIDNETLDSDIPADGVANNLTASNFGTRFAEPEETTNIEIGLKASYENFAINIAAFDLEVEGFQSNVFVGNGFVLANAGEQSARGVEWDATWTPIEPLTLTFAGTYLDAEFDEFIGSQDIFGALNDVSGQQPAGVPPLSLAGSATWNHTFQNGWAGFLRGDIAYESNTPILDVFESIDAGAGTVAAAGGTVPLGSLTNFANIDRTQLLVNAGIGLDFDNGFALQGFVRNLTDDEFLVSSFPIPGLTGLFAGYPNAPRTYGITGRYSF